MSKKVKKVKLKLTKKCKLLLSTLLVLLIGVVGTSFAYYTSKVNLENSFKTSSYNVEFSEDWNGTWGKKKITLMNKENSTSVLIRFNFDEVWSNKLNDGSIVNLSNKVSGERVVNLNTPSDFNTNFIQADDGWYYYKKILMPNESIDLLESISLNEDLIATSPYYEDYKSYDYDLSYNYEAIQASTDAAKEIWNLDISISSTGDVTWPF